ncbi:MAG: 5-formyltetrahydrofolate cyclo-ligase [Alphaproteobacteria bacterium]|nr:5-formyltetrahydrofolate cyclo-ligase [Alphaproteobacteria bacterium]
MTESKASLRLRLRKLRRSVHVARGEEAALSLQDHLIPCLGPVNNLLVAGYWPMGSEMDPRPLMASLQDRGARLALPVVTARNEALSFRAFCFVDALQPGLCGSLEPAPDQPLLTPSLLLVPLLGFDHKGCRLGQGGGYYDRTLAVLRTQGQVKAIGIAYAAQEVASLPSQAHDQRLDAIATEEGFIEI